jgi:glutamyl-tRNA synthetase
LPVKQKVALVVPFLQKAGLVSSPPPCDLAPKLTNIVAAAGDRLKVAGDIIAYADFFFLPDDAFTYDEKAFEKRVRKPETPERLARFRALLADVPDDQFQPPTLEKLLHDFVAEEGIAIGEIIHAVRIAVTGQSVGPGLFDCLAILGKRSSLARIDRTLALV